MKKKFTLIELLVVVSIIGILVAILLPALMRTKESARRAVCLSNTKQVGYALSMYGDDNGYLPGGNATVNAVHGIDSTFSVNGQRDYGIAFLVTQNYIPGAEVLYCPSWSHPYNQYDVIDTSGLDPWFGNNNMGGWPAPGNTGPTKHRLISYHYRSTFGSTYNEAPDINHPDPSSTAVTADHWTRREVLFGYEYGHRDAYATLYLDGHSQIVDDPGANYMQSEMPHGHDDGLHGCNKVTNRSWTFQETVWIDFFDIN